jgi:hypothetical protein
MSALTIRLNARLRPLDRGDRYEDPLQNVLDERAAGSEITGGGTMLDANREPAWSDISVDLTVDPAAGLATAVAALESFGAPKGSTATLDGGEPVPFGTFEGVGLYLNGTDLPAEVYTDNDVNELLATLLGRLGEEGDMQSYWEGPTETALYFYGPSAERMRALIADVVAGHPLAQRSRLVALT